MITEVDLLIGKVPTLTTPIFYALSFPLRRLGNLKRALRAAIKNFLVEGAKPGIKVTKALHVCTLFSTCIFKGA